MPWRAGAEAELGLHALCRAPPLDSPEEWTPSTRRDTPSEGGDFCETCGTAAWGSWIPDGSAQSATWIRLLPTLHLPCRGAKSPRPRSLARPRSRGLWWTRTGLGSVSPSPTLSPPERVAHCHIPASWRLLGEPHPCVPIHAVGHNLAPRGPRKRSACSQGRLRGWCDVGPLFKSGLGNVFPELLQPSAESSQVVALQTNVPPGPLRGWRATSQSSRRRCPTGRLFHTRAKILFRDKVKRTESLAPHDTKSLN